MAARFRFLLDDFIDKRVLLGGDELSVFEVTDKHVYLAITAFRLLNKSFFVIS
jgi:hypothetical protein